SRRSRLRLRLRRRQGRRLPRRLRLRLRGSAPAGEREARRPRRGQLQHIQGRQRPFQLLQPRILLPRMTAETTWDVEAIARAAHPAEPRCAPRAAEYDRTAAFPALDCDELFAAGLNAPT